MDPMTFNRIKGELQQQHFKSEKFDVLRSSISISYGYISADQVAELVREFSFDDEKLEAVQICVPKMSQATCGQVVPLLSSFSFDKSKVKVVESIAHIIVDPANHHELDRAITFNSDREKARDAILARQPMGAPPPHHHHHHPHPHHPQPPHQHHSPYPGNYPAGQVPPPCNPHYPPAPGYSPYPGAPPPMGPTGPAGLVNAAAHAAVDGLTRPFGPPHHGHQPPGAPGYPYPGYPPYHH
ncbi:basic salivary proline-rich protein 2-like [Actinia tenebrosa]|uniref:Basic salivary proline-rich protein 2-like n=1 Tax=Actinia tenebrosa TaxID=6105 RepID=A0A6P8JBZ8_ACTTE|nr:basic salivary proline-rich protein 2-like [Actinia tenebrosa]